MCDIIPKNNAFFWNPTVLFDSTPIIQPLRRVVCHAPDHLFGLGGRKTHLLQVRQQRRVLWMWEIYRENHGFKW